MSLFPLVLSILIWLSPSPDRPAAGDMPPPIESPMTAERAKQIQSAWAKHLGMPLVETDSIGMKLVLIPPGEFLMGSTKQEYDRLMEVARGKPWAKWFQRFADTETPAHRVTISKPSYLGATEVTVGQFRRFVKETGYNATGKAMKSDPEHTASLAGFGFEDDQWVRKVGYDWKNVRYQMSDDHPVLNVSWHDAVAFCKWLTERETGRSRLPDGISQDGQESRPAGGTHRHGIHRYRLPTEAEGGHACRAGTETRLFFGNDRDLLPDYAWVDGNSGSHPHPVARKKPNPFGLYDVYGNLWEWCQDWSDYDGPARNIKGAYYAVSPKIDPQGPKTRRGKVVRGGSFDFGARSAFRVWGGPPNNRRNHIGFRVVMTIDDSVPPQEGHGEPQAATEPAARSADQPKGTGANVDYTRMARNLVRYAHNPVIKVGKKGAWNDQTWGCFSVLDDGDRFLFYSGGARFGQKKKIGMATSKDGIHWTLYDKNPLFGGSMPHGIIKVGQTYRLYYAGWHGGLNGLQMRTSRDGFHWSPPKQVMGGCADPRVIRVRENKFHLYFCGGGRKMKNGKQVWEFKNYVAVSQDGIHWKKQRRPILPLGPPGTWDAASHAGPVVLKLPDGKFHLWYLGSGDMNGKIAWRVGHATSPDGIHWTRSGSKPVLDVGRPGDWDGGTLLSFDIILRDDKLHFWYAAAPTGHGDETKMTIQIGYGTSQ